MAKPHRVRRRRTKGWRMPPNTVYVGAPTRYSNIFPWRRLTRSTAVRMYRRWLKRRIPLRDMLRLVGRSGIKLLAVECLRQDLLRREIPKLRGKNLCCWCPLDQPCHADVLLEIANC
ncbi:MAG: DUF4326 domain-containing protein [Phycisphaerae bacterium]|nr:DUF4326 domain-containing protein [Phycisphaerae bacterium]